MLELPEVLTLAKQWNETIQGKTIAKVEPPSKPHKFCWFNGDPQDYDAQMRGVSIVKAVGFGAYAELRLDNGWALCLNDGVNARLLADESDAPKAYQLMIRFTDGQSMAFTVAMYGGIMLHDKEFDNDYYQKSRQGVSPFAPEFDSHFEKLVNEAKPSLSAKGLLATEQRIPGLGNGVLQDILFAARIHPRRKVRTLDEAELSKLRHCITDTLQTMTDQGGRNTEKDLFGHSGGYQTIMSKNNTHCPICGGPITKEAYMGGSVYYCPICQR